MTSYKLAWLVGAALFLVNVGIAAIQAVYASGHGADLGISPQAQAWLAIVSTIVAAALIEPGTVLPNGPAVPPVQPPQA